MKPLSDDELLRHCRGLKEKTSEKFREGDYQKSLAIVKQIEENLDKLSNKLPYPARVAMEIELERFEQKVRSAMPSLGLK